MSEFQNYVLPAAMAAFLLWRWLKHRRTHRAMPRLLDEGAQIVDVRSKAEWQAASNPKSINIPLSELDSGLSRLDPKKPLVLCCASGTRSGMAAAIAKGKGFSQVHNAGPWQNTLAP